MIAAVRLPQVRRIPEAGVSVALVSGGQIEAFRGDLEGPLKKSISRSHDEVTFEDVMGLIRSGASCCWIATDGSRVVGVAVGEPLMTRKGTWLNLPFAWVDRSLSILNRMMDQVEEYADASGFYGVKFVSSNEAFRSWAERRGYRQRFVEYVREGESDG